MIYLLDEFTENERNPITQTKYDDNWVVFILTDRKEYNQFVGSINGCAYTVKFSRYANSDWRLALCDFISYHNENGKNIILVLSEDECKEAKQVYKGHNYKEKHVRDGEPRILVHSTTLENYGKIKKAGRLKSFHRLGIQDEPIGQQLGDPEEFRDYIMFSGGGVTPEIVVNSKQKGRITMDVNEPYRPGARLYFDALKIAEDGLLVRDGCHLKVKSELPLSPYLIFAATAESIGLGKGESTPMEFSTCADQYFHSVYKFNL